MALDLQKENSAICCFDFKAERSDWFEVTKDQRAFKIFWSSYRNYLAKQNKRTFTLFSERRIFEIYTRILNYNAPILILKL